jgi:hypothetical protein
MMGLVFPFWWWGRGDYCFFFFFFKFSMCSQYVLSMFPWGFPSYQVVPQGIPNSTSILSHMVCRKFNSHVYKLKGRLLGNTSVFFLHGVQRDASIGECSMFPKNMLMGQWIWLFQKKKNRCELINMNHTISHYIH